MLAGNELHQGKRYFVVEAQPKTRISEQADLYGHTELIVGAAPRQNEIPVAVTERIKPEQGGLVVRHSEEPFAVGIVQQAPSCHRVLRLLVRQSILSRPIALLSGKHA
jgi:hypothetical protein